MQWAEKVEARSLEPHPFGNSVADGRLTKEPWVRGSAWRITKCRKFIFEPDEIADLVAYLLTIREPDEK
jgi:hypothetical protein